MYFSAFQIMCHSLCSCSIMKQAFAKATMSQALAVHQEQSGVAVNRKKPKRHFSQVASLILLHELSTQAVTSTGPTPQINCKRVFAKRSLALLSWNLTKKCPWRTENCPRRHVDYRTTSKHLLFLPLKAHSQVYTGMFMLGYCFLGVYYALSFTYPSKYPCFSLWIW